MTNRGAERVDRRAVGMVGLGLLGAAVAGRVVFSLPDSGVVESVLAEAAPALRPGLVLADTTTGDPVRTAAIGSRLAGRAVAYVDATVLGSSAEVRSAAAVAMVGGERAACEG